MELAISRGAADFQKNKKFSITFFTSFLQRRQIFEKQAKKRFSAFFGTFWPKQCIFWRALHLKQL